MWIPEIGDEVRVQRHSEKEGNYEVIGVVLYWGQQGMAGGSVAKVKIGRWTETLCKGQLKPLVPEEDPEVDWDDRPCVTSAGRTFVQQGVGA